MPWKTSKGTVLDVILFDIYMKTGALDTFICSIHALEDHKLLEIVITVL